ncbi:MAG TPA: basic amino acid ABC transporter substrate-binding protein [Vicinamibacterales bacterium]|nr:basic amino acid ABC transporter substrate-binding protein [Vicinamibacterales bacterium]
MVPLRGTVVRVLSTVGGALALTVALCSMPARAQTRTLVVGSSATYPPFAYENPAKQIVGFDVDIINAIAIKAGLKIRVINTPWTGIFASLNNGDIDLIVSGVTINDKRRQSYSFTSPYFEARQLIAVPAASTVKTLRDLAGRKVGVVVGSAGDDIASATFGKTSPNIRRFESTPVMVQELAASGLDAAIGDNGVIAYRVQEQPRLKTVDDPAFPREYFGIVVKQGNTVLLDKLNAGLAAVKADGTYASLYRKWFKTDPPPLPAR